MRWLSAPGMQTLPLEEVANEGARALRKVNLGQAERPVLGGEGR